MTGGEIRQCVLSGGLKVAARLQEGVGLAAFCLSTDASSLDEGGLTGMRSLIKEVLLEAYKSQKGGIAGDSIQVDVTSDLVTIGGCHLSGCFDRYLRAIAHPLLHFDRYLDSVDIGAIKRKMLTDSALTGMPWLKAMDCFTGQLYGDHPYARPLRGSPETLGAIGKKDVSAFFARHFAAGKSAVSVVGDVRPGDLAPSIDRAFTGLRPAGAPEANRCDRRPRPLQKPTAVVMKDAGGGLAWVVVGYPVPDIRSEDAAGYVLRDLADRMVYDEVRQKRKWAYHAFAGYCDQVYGGHFMCVACTPSALAESARDVMIDIVHGLRTADVPGDVLFAQKQKQKGMYLWINEGLIEQAQMLSVRQLMGLELDYATTLWKIDRVTPGDICQFARRHFDGNYVSVVVE